MTTAATRRADSETAAREYPLPFRESVLCPAWALNLDVDNPRLQTGSDHSSGSQRETIETLADIAALDELVLSICTNKYQNLEPLIVHGPGSGPYRVLEGNRRLAAIRLIEDPGFAAELGIKVPKAVPSDVRKSIEKILVYRVRHPDDAREFIGFKHINGPQRWDAYAKARYVTDWYRKSQGSLTISDIASKMGDNNNTLRSYIYAILMLDQADEAGVWKLEDRPPSKGRFPFSHLYTAISRLEYQEFLGLTSWTDAPPPRPVKKANVEKLGEVLTYLYGSKSDARVSLIQSQNPDLKNLGMVIADPRARAIVENRGTLDKALDELKEPASAFYDALITAKLRLGRAIDLMPKYAGGNADIDSVVEEIFAQADILKTMNDKSKSRARR
jgi:hypothetical protein